MEITHGPLMALREWALPHHHHHPFDTGLVNHHSHWLRGLHGDPKWHTPCRDLRCSGEPLLRQSIATQIKCDRCGGELRTHEIGQCRDNPYY